MESTLLNGVPKNMLNSKQFKVEGRILKIASIKEEWFHKVDDPVTLVNDIKEKKIKADIFKFWQMLPNLKKNFNYYSEKVSIAAIEIKSYEHWYKNQVNSNTRRNIKKSVKKGIKLKICEFNDEFIEGMTSIFNETPIRQGRKYLHYGKDFNTVKKQFSRYLFREDLIGAYYNDELIGFIMLSHSQNFSILGQIISKEKYRILGTNNALISKAVEYCEKNKIGYLVYSMWDGGDLQEFKRRNGFKKYDLPRYYIPITFLGKIAITLKLHRGLKHYCPNLLIYVLKKTRKDYLKLKYHKFL